MHAIHVRMQDREHGHVARPLLAMLQLVTGVGAVYGAYELATEAWELDERIVRFVPLHSWVLAGVALLALVALPQLAAFEFLMLDAADAPMVSAVVGFGLLLWIAVEVALAWQFSALQPAFFAVGAAEWGLARRLVR